MPFFDSDRARIYYRLWEVDEPVAGLLFLHGGGEHSGQFSRLAARLNASDINVWAIDHRGHGISGGPRGFVSEVDVLVDDAASLTGIIRRDLPDLPLVVGGHSLGGWITALLLIRDPRPYVGAVLTGASLRGGPSLETDPKGDFAFDTSLLAADPSYLEELEKDPLVQLELPTVEPSPLAAAAQQIAGAFEQVDLPILIVNGTEDRLASIDDARHWRDALPEARLLEVHDGLHNVLNDVDYRTTTAAISDFVLEVTSSPLGAAR